MSLAATRQHHPTSEQPACIMQSGNPFDVIGAISSGMRGAWVKRSERACFDPWEIQPTTTVSDIGELKDEIEAQER